MSDSAAAHPVAGIAVSVAAHAKLNLTLAVGGRRPDGFHDLRSVMVPLSIADRLEARPLPPGAGADRLEISGAEGLAEATGPVADNLVLRAVAELRTALAGAVVPSGPLAPLAFTLRKEIPVAAGLAGGSSDAAAAIDAALAAWGLSLPDAERAAIGERVGSDVPFFFARGWAIVEGRGERVEPVAGPNGLAVLIVTPGVPVPTGPVFGALAASRAAGPSAASDASAASAQAVATTDRLIALLRTGGATAAQVLEMAPELAEANDLAPAAASIVPSLEAFRRDLAALLGRPAGQSGSGPSCWVLYASLQQASAAADRLRAAVAQGAISVPGERPPFVAATAIRNETGRNE